MFSFFYSISPFIAQTIPLSTKKAMDEQIPFPHILYAALSEYGFFSHFSICLRDFGLQVLPTALLYVSKTFCHHIIFSSVGFSMPISSHHYVGIPCSNAHSCGVSRLTMYSISGVLSLTTGGSL